MMKVLYPYPVTINPPRNNWYMTDLGRLWFNHGTSEWSTGKEAIKKPTIWYTTETPPEIEKVLERVKANLPKSGRGMGTSPLTMHVPICDCETLLQTLKAE